MKIGYIRVSTTEQNTTRQEVLLQELGVDELFIDRASGKNTDRPELKRMLAYVRQGDTVIVESISRFARNTRDLLELIAQLTAKQSDIVLSQEDIAITPKLVEAGKLVNIGILIHISVDKGQFESLKERGIL